MYTEHFGLESPVVRDGIARDDMMFRGTAQMAMLADLSTALCRSNAAVVIRGPAGSGKSTLAAAAFRESATQLALGSLTDAPQTPHELLEQLLLEFGFSPYKQSRTERLVQWRQFLGEMTATGTRIGIVVENADRMHPEILAELERLTSADIRGVTGANLLLTTRREIFGPGADEALTALSQRCRRVVDVAPLSADETTEYLRFCVGLAGGVWEAIFEPGADSAIHAASGGIIRVIDSILESSLARAALTGDARVETAIVEQVVASLPAWQSQPATRAADSEATADTGASDAADDASDEPKYADRQPHSAAPAGKSELRPESESITAPAGAAAMPGPATQLPPAIDPEADPDPTAAEPAPQRTAAATKAAPLDPTWARDSAGADNLAATPDQGAPAKFMDSTMDLPPSAAAVSSEVPLELIPELEFAVDFPASGSQPRASANSPNPNAGADGKAIEPTGMEPATAADIPILEDAVADSDVKLAQDRNSVRGLDSESVDQLLAASAAVAALIQETSRHTVTGPAATAGSPSESDGVSDSESETDGDLSEEDREQIEMLEAFANAEALEEMSESMAETIFGDSDVDEIAKSLRETQSRGGRP